MYLIYIMLILCALGIHSNESITVHDKVSDSLSTKTENKNSRDKINSSLTDRSNSMLNETESTIHPEETWNAREFDQELNINSTCNNTNSSVDDIETEYREGVMALYFCQYLFYNAAEVFTLIFCLFQRDLTTVAAYIRSSLVCAIIVSNFPFIAKDMLMPESKPINIVPYINYVYLAEYIWVTVTDSPTFYRTLERMRSVVISPNGVYVNNLGSLAIARIGVKAFYQLWIMSPGCFAMGLSGATMNFADSDVERWYSVTVCYYLMPSVIQMVTLLSFLTLHESEVLHRCHCQGKVQRRFEEQELKANFFCTLLMTTSILVQLSSLILRRWTILRIMVIFNLLGYISFVIVFCFADRKYANRTKNVHSREPWNPTPKIDRISLVPS